MKKLALLGLMTFAALFFAGCIPSSFPVLHPELERFIPERLLVAKKENLPKLKRQAKQEHLRIGSPVFIRIFKQEQALEVWLKRPGQKTYGLFKVYPICNWSGKLGPKLQEGDLQSPEGFYHVGMGDLNPNSSYHLSFNLGFPNAYDQHYERTGSYLMVHGGCSSKGCYAMTDESIEEIYVTLEAAFINGQAAVPVHIFPFRMTEENMRRYYDPQWLSFWYNLKRGYDIFEYSDIPPQTMAINGQYMFF